MNQLNLEFHSSLNALSLTLSFAARNCKIKPHISGVSLANVEMFAEGGMLVSRQNIWVPRGPRSHVEQMRATHRESSHVLKSEVMWLVNVNGGNDQTSLGIAAEETQDTTVHTLSYSRDKKIQGPHTQTKTGSIHSRGSSPLM